MQISKGTTVVIQGLFPQTTKMKDGDYYKDQVFYVLGNRDGLINTKDVILETSIQKPWYVFPATKAAIIKSPLGAIVEEGFSIRRYGLWLKVSSGDYKWLGYFPEGKFCNEDLKLSISPSGSYAYLNGSNTVFSTDGSKVHLIRHEPFADPLWYGDLLLLRKQNFSDAIDKMNPVTGERWTIAAFAEGSPLNLRTKDNCLLKNPEFTVENNMVKAKFLRRNLKQPEQLDDECIEISMVSTLSNSIVSTDKKFISCRSALQEHESRYYK
jgi:hypothetical protein